MSAYRRDDDEDDWDDDDDALEDDSLDEPTISCPSCRHDILEDTPRCPSCGHYLSEADRMGPRRPTWVVATALICLAIALWWIFAAV